MAKKILILSTTFGAERDEIVRPLNELREKGHEVVVATPDGKDVQCLLHDHDYSDVVPADLAIDHISGDFDVVVLPGGTINADAGRGEEGLLALVKKQADAGRTIAAICHAPWLLIDAGIVEGKKLTAYDSIRIDLKNAGAGEVVDEPLVSCDAGGYTLLTSRNPDDLDTLHPGHRRGVGAA